MVIPIKFRDRWTNLLQETLFFFKLRQISRLYRELSKHKAREYKREELDLKAKATIGFDFYHMILNRELSRGIS